ncbi:MAG TPA: SpoIID/LytB domain-containing protein [Clostridia bacterium]|nr:SpoIID/LytB domain-containing protein [Clostridia bacterium]
MRLTIIEPSDSCREMRGSIEAMLAAMQIETRVVSSPTDRQSLSQAISAALAEADLVLVVGGMSHGGVAREAAAEALGRSLIRSKAAAGYIEQRCREQDLIFSEFAGCCFLPQGAKSFAGDGLFPACLCLHGERALLLFDEYDDPAQLFRLKTLLSSLFSSIESAPVTPVETQPSKTVQPPSETAAPAKLRHSARKAQKKQPPHPARGKGRSNRNQAVIGYIAVGCVLAVMALTGAAAALLGKGEDKMPVQQANVSSASSQQSVVFGPVRESPSWRLKASSSESEVSSSTSEAPSSPTPASSSAPASASPSFAAASPSQAEASSSSAPAVASSVPAVSSAPESSAPESSSPTQVASTSTLAVSSSSEESVSVYVYEGEDDDKDDSSTGSGDTPSAHDDAFDEKLSYTSGGSVKRMNAYDLVCQIMQNETHGNLAPEALKAHVVATYTMIKYNNSAGIAPAVLLNSNISSAVENAVDAVLGVAVYYNGKYANTVYHSTSSGYTTSSQAVWGGALPYLVSVESDYDRKSPYYKSSYTISEDDFAAKVKKVYGITLDGDPEDWISVEHDAPGGYVGTVEIGGETRSQGGTYGTGTITGRSVREKLLSFALRSHCFDVDYNASKERFEFTVYGYGHGVGMSQYGAHFMALDGYDYVDILEHYYTDTEIY